MKTFNYVITDEQGVHARPAGELIKACKNYACKITMTKDGKVGDCKKIFTIMGLGVKCGNEVVMSFDGADEDAACAEIEAFMKANL